MFTKVIKFLVAFLSILTVIVISIQKADELSDALSNWWPEPVTEVESKMVGPTQRLVREVDEPECIEILSEATDYTLVAFYSKTKQAQGDLVDTLENLALKNKDRVRIVKSDVEKNAGWIAKIKVSGSPDFHLYLKNELIETRCGPSTQEQLQRMLDQHFATKPLAETAPVEKPLTEKSATITKPDNPAPPAATVTENKDEAPEKAPTITPIPKNWVYELPDGVIPRK